jgi:predicted flap endonuclease-1-like 5' DNA nuclease
MKIEKIEGIGSRSSEILRKEGIKTLENLRWHGATRQGRKEIARKTGLPEKIILRWVNRADIMRIRGVGEEYSDLLEMAGVDTLKELMRRNPANLHQAMIRVNQERRLIRRAPSKNDISKWILQANTLEGDPSEDAPPPIEY